MSGSLGRTDNTLGRNRGLALNMTDATPDGTVKLSKKTTMPPGGSVARHDQVQKYCTCDRKYKLLDYLHLGRLCRWYRAVKGVRDWKLNANATWMKICLLAWPEKEHWARHAWWGRWLAYNDTTDDLYALPCTLHGLRVPLRSPLDCVILLLDEKKEIVTPVYPESCDAESVTFTIPLLEAGKTMFIDMYWICNPPEGWDTFV
mgnify:CR=1 FL=1